jgi:hypothetical protein
MLLGCEETAFFVGDDMQGHFEPQADPYVDRSFKIFMETFDIEEARS